MVIGIQSANVLECAAFLEYFVAGTENPAVNNAVNHLVMRMYHLSPFLYSLAAGNKRKVNARKES